MPRPRTQLDALSPGQLAKRWGLAVDRVRRLIKNGHVPGAFKVPAAGQNLAGSRPWCMESEEVR